MFERQLNSGQERLRGYERAHIEHLIVCLFVLNFVIIQMHICRKLQITTYPRDECLS